MNQFTVEIRDALVELGLKGFALPAPEYVEFAGMKLKPGNYGRAKGYAKTCLIVTTEGQTFYKDKRGTVGKRLTENAFLTHWNAGMSTYLGVSDEY